MRSKHLALAGALALGLALTPQLKADVQSRINVIAHALVSAKHLQLEQVAVGGFTDSTGQAPPFASILEADLRRALSHYKKHWKVLSANRDPSTADAVLTGSFERDGDIINVHVQVLAQPEGTILWQRDTVLDGAAVSDADLPGASDQQDQGGPAYGAGPGGPVALGDQGEDQVIPTLPYSRGMHYGRRFNIDVSIAYQAFLPTNGAFRGAVGSTLNGLSLGMAFNDVFLWDMAFWGQGVSNPALGTTQSLNYAGTDFALVYPIHYGLHLCIYAGPGARFGEIDVNDPALVEGPVAYGNNALMAVAGVKWKEDDVGVDLRYTTDLAFSYTGYNTLRFGVFYEF